MKLVERDGSSTSQGQRASGFSAFLLLDQRNDVPQSPNAFRQRAVNLDQRGVVDLAAECFEAVAAR
jgi:hypothetical protein